jgi:hypothetical protein
LIQGKRRDFLKIAKNSEVQEYESNYPNQEIYHLAKSSNNSSDSDGGHQHQRSSWMLSDLEKLEPDPIMPHLFERLPLNVPAVDDHEPTAADARPHLGLFNVYPPPPSVVESTAAFYAENRLSFAEPPVDPRTTKILVKCTHLKFDLDLEPIWATMALYDLRERRKISENFAFDLNGDGLKQMLNTHQTHQDASTQARASILNVTYPSADLFLVVRVEKVLQQGDVSECAEPYVKAQQQSVSAVEKLQQNANQFCERLGKYHMPFAWTAINLTSILTTSGANPAASCGSGAQANIIDLEDVKSSTDSKSLMKTGLASMRKSTLPPTASLTSPTSLNTRDDSLLRNKNGGGTSNNSSKDANTLNTGVTASNTKGDDSQLGVSLSHFKPIAISINTFFKQESDKLADEDLFRCLSELKKSTNLIKKLKCLPGCLKMEFSPFNYEFSTDYSQLPNYLSGHYVLSPELQLLKFPTNVLLTEKPQHHGGGSAGLASGNGAGSQYHQSLLLHNHLLPIKDVLEFPSYGVHEPCGSYRNLLFIYPLAINLCGANQTRIGIINCI